MVIQMSPRGFLHVMFRHRWLFLLCFFGIFSLAATYSLVATRIYRSEAVLAVKFENDNQNGVPGAAITAQSSEHQEIINTNIRLLKSMDLLVALAAKFEPLKLYPRLAEDLNNPESLVDRARDQLAHDFKVTAERDSDVIDVSLDNPDAAVAPAALADLIGLFIERQTRLYRHTQSSLMAEQVEAARRRMGESQARLDSFVSKFGISSLEDELAALLRREMDAHTALDEQKSKMGEALGRRDAAAAALSGLKPEITLSDERSGYKAVDAESLIGDYRPHLARTGPNPVFQQTETDLVRASEDVDAARGAIKPLEQQLRQIEDRLQELNSRKAQYHALKMQSEADEKSYRTFVQRTDNSRVAEILNSQNVNAVAVLQRATMPMQPVWPKAKLTLGLALLLGCVFGVAASLISERLDETFSLPDQMEAVLGLPVLGAFQMSRALRSGRDAR